MIEGGGRKSFRLVKFETGPACENTLRHTTLVIKRSVDKLRLQIIIVLPPYTMLHFPLLQSPQTCQRARDRGRNCSWRKVNSLPPFVSYRPIRQPETCFSNKSQTRRTSESYWETAVHTPRHICAFTWGSYPPLRVEAPTAWKLCVIHWTLTGVQIVAVDSQVARLGPNGQHNSV